MQSNVEGEDGEEKEGMAAEGEEHEREKIYLFF